MKQAYVANNPVEAHIVRGRLAAAGIQAVVQGEELYALRGEVPFTQAFPSVWVADEDFERARQELEEDR